MKKLLVTILVLFPIFANLYLLSPELKIYSDVNDNVFAYALAYRMNQAWDDGSCPWNLPKCLPSLTDHWVSYWAQGYPLPHYYQHLPSIFNVAAFKLAATLGLVPNTTSALQVNQTNSRGAVFAPQKSNITLQWNNETMKQFDYQLPGLFIIFNITKYLLLCLFPLSVFWAARKFQFPKIAAGMAAFLSLLISTNFQYGTDYGSLIWRGSGMHTQLWGMFFLPLALGSLYETITSGRGEVLSPSNNLTIQQFSNKNFRSSNSRGTFDTRGTRGTLNSFFIHTPHFLRTVLLLFLTIQSHILFGYLAALSGALLLLCFIIYKWYLIVTEDKSNIKTENRSLFKIFRRVIELALKNLKLLIKPVIIFALIFFTLFLLLSYFIIPLFVNDAYHAHSVWDELYKFDSFGAREVINRYLDGSMFDYNRFPVLTLLVFIGFFYGLNNFGKLRTLRNSEIEPANSQTNNSTLQNNSNNSCGTFDTFDTCDTFNISYLFLPLLLLFWTILYFGRTTWGPLTNLLPGSEGIHLHRFINGVHFAGIFLAGLGLYWLIQKILILFSALFKIVKLSWNLSPENISKDNISILNNIKNNIRTVDSSTLNYSLLTSFLIFIFSFLILFPALKERYEFVSHNSFLIKNYNQEYLKDWPDFSKIASQIKTPGRIWAGRPGNWGKQFKVGGSEVYLILSSNGFDTLGFEPESWSPNTDLEQYFNDQREDHYNLFNVKYIIAPPKEKFPPFAKKVTCAGKYCLYKIKTTGNFDLVSSDLTIYGNKYNTLNLLRFWLDSTWPKAKSHPLVKYEKFNNTRLLNRDSQLSTFNFPLSININDWTSFQRYYPEGFDQTPASLLTINPFNATPSANLKSTSQALIKDEVVKNNYYAVKVYTPSPSLLLLKVTYHPFWKAYIDGKQSKITMTAPYFMSINLPKGESTIEFKYGLIWYKKLLLLVSSTTLLLLLLSPILKRIRRHRS